MENLKLYILQTCPYCNKVRSYLDGKDFDVELMDISDPANEEELIRIGGKRQVPFLYVNEDEFLYESDDIIEWFKARE